MYLAEHKRLHTRWAVKEVAKQQSVRFDFLAESNILKKLQHPMLPRIVDIFENDSHVYLVEDFVEGITLSDWLKQQPRADEELALQWFKDLCNVLRYLHGQTPRPIIYRDLKPSNIMLQPDGSLKLIDFGIAREYKQESSADTTYVGTKGYAAPEQFGKAQTDARTDIYALGVTMYHLVTGKSPYSPPYQFVPARQLVPSLSHGMEYILNKCVQPEPADRYQNVDELLGDLEHIYRFDTAWKRFKRVKRIRKVIIAALLASSLALIGMGWMQMGAEREQAFYLALEDAYTAAENGESFEDILPRLTQAQELMSGGESQTSAYDSACAYAQYKTGRFEDCVRDGLYAIENHAGSETSLSLRAVVACAQFELGEYKDAAENFAYSGLSATALDSAHDDPFVETQLRDYAVCLGRLGQIDEAEEILQKLVDAEAASDVTTYVQGEVYMAQKNYPAAEEAFLEALPASETDSLTRRCYLSLGDLYRECAALARTGQSPIQNPATKSAELLAQAVSLEGMRYDTVLWEQLAMAYFESYHTDTSAPPDYLRKSAECFKRVIGQGVVKEYLYANLYTIYYEMQDYAQAGEALDSYETAFPQSYMPHALRGMMLITVENSKPDASRDYSAALEEYETAGDLIRGSDEASYYQQLGTLIDELRRNGWL